MARSSNHPTHYWFRCNVRARLLQMRWTQSELADAAGMSRSHLNQVLGGSRPLSNVTMERIALAFGILDYTQLLKKPDQL